MYANHTVDGDRSSPSDKRMRLDERGESRSKRHHAKSSARPRRFGVPDGLAFARCSDLP
jgi:hypothetical protein